MSVKKCDECVHWSRHVCKDSEGTPVKREAKLAEPFWYYEECKKNWGLPKNAHVTANYCNHYKRKLTT